MTDVLEKPLRGAALYNPHLLSKQELVTMFRARVPLLDRLLADLRAVPAGQPAQHHLLIGQRGTGKTMLLHRLGFAIEDDPELSEEWLPLTFPEEQYNVAGLADFWLNCLDALSDRIERSGDRSTVAEIDQQIESLRSIPEGKRRDEALAVLVGAAGHIGRRLVLLVDNADLVLDRLSEKEEWVLRETLSREAALVFIGASAAADEATYEHGRAFYDFFHVHELGGLSLEEMRDLLTHHADVLEEPTVAEIAERHHGRLRTLHTLTGGNPRTVMLLFNVLVRGLDGDVRSDLEHLLDQCTPLYKARFEALPEQAQRVVHALALHWDPISAGELAGEIGLKVNLVSAQLNRLVQQGVVEKVPYHPASKTGFQIAERFFNIWYLMRASRRVRRRLIWLVEFLRLYYSQGELEERAREHMEVSNEVREPGRAAHAEMAFALAEALRDESWRRVLEDVGLRKLVESPILRGCLAELVDVAGDDPILRWRADHLLRFQALREAIGQCPPAVSPDLRRRLLTHPFLGLSQKAELVNEVKHMGQEGLARLEAALDIEASQPREMIGVAREAVETGEMLAYDDVLGATGIAKRQGDVSPLVNSMIFQAIRCFFFAGTGAPVEFAGLSLPPAPPPDPEERRLALVFLGWVVYFESDESALRLLEAFELNERWLPVREAVKAAVSGRERLQRLAPEIRKPTADVLEIFDRVRQVLDSTSGV